jgi:hypothetical protein
MEFSMDQYWPVSIFTPVFPSWQEGVTLVAILLLLTGWWVAFRQKVSPLLLIGLTLPLMMATNLLGGVEGLRNPMGGYTKHDHQYWQDTDKMSSLGGLLPAYTLLQPTLHIHSRVHPPGPMVVIWSLRQLRDDPAFVGAVMAVAAILSAGFFYLIARHWFTDKAARAMMGVYLLLPAVQIYGWATIDALILLTFAAAAYGWLKRGEKRWFLVCVVMTWLSMLLTFAGLLLIGFYVVEEFWRGRKINHSAKVFFLVGGLWLLMELGFGYSYLESFEIARSFEGPGGFYGFRDPLSYVMTRAEDVLEPLVFLGPVVFLFLLLGVRSGLFGKSRPDWFPFFGSMLTVMGVFLLGGAYYTGETARAALFLVPFLLLPVGYAWEKSGGKLISEKGLLLAVFAQTVVMQLFGRFGW